MACDCNTTTTEHTLECQRKVCILPVDYRNFILQAFEGNDSCIAENLSADDIDFYMELAKAEFCTPELIFLRTYQSVVYALMNCYAYQYDVTERYGESHANTTGNARVDGFKQEQKTGSSYNLDRQGMTARYADYSRARMDAQSERLGCSHSDSYGIATMDDSSAGSSKRRARQRMIAQSLTDAKSHSESTRTSDDKGFTRAADWTHSYSGTANSHAYLIVAKVVETSNKDHSTRAMESNGRSSGTTTETNQDWRYAYTDKTRLSGVRKDSCANFNANVIGTSKDQAASDSSNKYHAERHQRQRAEGDGFQRASQDVVTRSSSQGTERASRNGDSARDNRSWKFSTIKSYKRSQKYATLSSLYTQLQTQIASTLSHIASGCAPHSSSVAPQPFLDVANCGNRQWTIDLILSRFPITCCFGLNPGFDYGSQGLPTF